MGDLSDRRNCRPPPRLLLPANAPGAMNAPATGAVPGRDNLRLLRLEPAPGGSHGMVATRPLQCHWQWPDPAPLPACASAQRSVQGIATTTHRLKPGHAIHELVFGLLFRAIVAIPLRHGQWWAWWVCWVVLLADLGPYRHPWTRARTDVIVVPNCGPVAEACVDRVRRGPGAPTRQAGTWQRTGRQQF
jgi:hypothetical protein